MQSWPRVTLVIVPRDRFNYAQRSLDSIYEHTNFPFKLIYVDANSPDKLRKYLKKQARLRDFALASTQHFLTPNQARNLGLMQVDTDYVVFIDNDVIVSPGWLEALIHCAEETGAAVVGPLICQREPVHQEIHVAGGEAHVWIDKQERRRFREKIYLQGKKVDEVRNELKRTSTEMAEFHCVLVRRTVFDRIDRLDESMMNTKEHLDFCMSIRELGETVYFEPDAIVTFVEGGPRSLKGIHYHSLRWSNSWTRASLDHLREKWNLAEDEYFKARYKNHGKRRQAYVLYPLVHKLTGGFRTNSLINLLSKVEEPINDWLVRQNQKRKLKL